jgi:hypothetical protein
MCSLSLSRNIRSFDAADGRCKTPTEEVADNLEVPIQELVEYAY